MKVLLDECLPRKLAAQLAGHEVMTVPQAGWAGIKNGRLLNLAAEYFEVFITADRNLSFQQNPATSEIAVIVLGARSNRLQSLLPLVPKVLRVMGEIRRGETRVVSEDAKL